MQQGHQELAIFDFGLPTLDWALPHQGIFSPSKD
jgi:hypothetical protein